MNRLVTMLLALASLAATPAVAEMGLVDSVMVHVDHNCTIGTVELTIEMDVWGQVQAEVVGWIVERKTLGACVPDVQVGVIHPFEAGVHVYTVSDLPEVLGRQALYYVYGVGTSGERWWVNFGQRTNFEQTDCRGGPAARGMYVVPAPGTYQFDVCPEECWFGFSYLTTPYVPEWPELVGQVIDLYGSLGLGMEGPYLSGDIFWFPAPDGCGPVATSRMSWSAVKAIYR
jgi:hypothetical protein